MRLAWFSPLPPLQSGIADYSAELVPFVARRATVDVYCPRPSPTWRSRVRAPEGANLLRPEQFKPRSGLYDAVFYHLGNNPFHQFVYEAFLERPGVAVFHDYVLHHLIAHMTVEQSLRHRDWPRYLELMGAEYGDAGRRFAHLRWRGVATEFEKFLLPLNGHVAARATAIVAHNGDTAERLSAVAPHAPVAVIPHHAGSVPPQVAGLTREEARDRLGLPRSAFVVGHFGFITRPKQPAAVVRGFARLVERHPDAMLALVGADRSGGGLARLVTRHGLEEKVRLVGFADLATFTLYLKAVDAVVNLRYPSAGESSGTFARALAEGRATIVNNVGSFAEVPTGVTLKVEIDADQAEGVAGHLLRLAGEPSFRTDVERRAHAYAQAELDPERCAGLYLQVAEHAAASPSAG